MRKYKELEMGKREQDKMAKIEKLPAMCTKELTGVEGDKQIPVNQLCPDLDAMLTM